jgi:hypothetical protein
MGDDDVGVRQKLQDLSFAEQTLDELGASGELGAKELDDDRGSAERSGRLVDLAHTSRTNASDGAKRGALQKRVEVGIQAP